MVMHRKFYPLIMHSDFKLFNLAMVIIFIRREEKKNVNRNKSLLLSFFFDRKLAIAP